MSKGFVFLSLFETAVKILQNYAEPETFQHQLEMEV